MRLELLLSPIIFLLPLSAAWQPFQIIRQEAEPLLARRADAASTNVLENKEADAVTSISDTASKTTSSSVSRLAPTKEELSSSNSAPSSAATITSKSSTTNDEHRSSTASYETTKTFNPSLPVGGIQMVTPNPIMDPAQYYRIDQYVTLAWNYTSLLATPKSVNVLASCALNTATYTIATNVPVHANATQAVVWDTGVYQASADLRLLTASYTLVIYDADKQVTSLPEAGYLATFNQFYFGMYSAGYYQPVAKYTCATCSGAGAVWTRQTLYFVLGTAGLTVLSFGWFGGVAGLW